MKNNELIAIVLIFLIVTVGACYIVSVVYPQNQSMNNSIPSPKPIIAPNQTVISPIETVLIIKSESQAPVVKITSQECDVDSHDYPVITTALENDSDNPISSDLILKIYKDSDTALGTFKQSVTIPPHGTNSTKIIMYGVNFFQASSMSTEYPGLEQIPPPTRKYGYICPTFRTP